MIEEELREKIRKLAMGIRLKAENIRETYRDLAPQQTQVAVQALETCAEQIEDLIK